MDIYAQTFSLYFNDNPMGKIDYVNSLTKFLILIGHQLQQIVIKHKKPPCSYVIRTGHNPSGHSYPGLTFPTGIPPLSIARTDKQVYCNLLEVFLEGKKAS
jgi:hypothetical protein